LQEKERGETLVQELIQLMSKVAGAVKHSPLLDRRTNVK
jgi:hypothetical protein